MKDLGQKLTMKDSPRYAVYAGGDWLLYDGPKWVKIAYTEDMAWTWIAAGKVTTTPDPVQSPQRGQ